MPDFLYAPTVILGVLAALVVPPALFALAGGAAGRVLGNLTGGLVANFSTAMRLYGGPAGELRSPLHVLEWGAVGDVAEALAELSDEEVAAVLVRLRPRFARKLRARLPAARLEWVDYWVERPQPFPRQAQAALARRLKRRLGLATTA